MEKVLVAVLSSDKPRRMKEQLVERVVGIARQEQDPRSVVSMLSTCVESILMNEDDFTRSSCLQVYAQWARHNPSVLSDFFTTQTLKDLLDVAPNSQATFAILLIHETFSVLPHNTSQFNQLCQIVQIRAISWVQEHCDFKAIKAFCELLFSHRLCIPIGVYTAKFCVSIINVVGTFSAPPDQLPAYIKGVSVTIGGLLHHIWSRIDENSILQCLQAIFVIISVDTDLDPSCALGGIVQHVPVKFVESATLGTVRNMKITDACMGRALRRMIDWLSWPMTRNIDVWIVAFLKGLGEAHKYTLLIEVTEAKILQVYEKLQYPVARGSAFSVLSHMLLSFQHSPQPFHKIVELLPGTISEWRREEERRPGSLRDLLPAMSHLCHCLIHLHGGFPDLYEPVLEALQGLPEPSTDVIRSSLEQSKWTSREQRSHVTYLTDLVKSDTGKTGLVNLGNTCYMNSVLQVLYMCDSFRQAVLDSVISPPKSLLTKLQRLFAFLKLTQRPAFSPREILEASRPPWFTVGAQQDCSEYLRYLLDTLHEEQKSQQNKQSSKAKTIIQTMFGGKIINTYLCLQCNRESSRLEGFTDLPLAFPDNAEMRSNLEEKSALAGGDGKSASETSVNENTACAPVPQEKTLAELMSFYLRPERFRGDNCYHCSHCRQLQEADRSIKIVKSPAYLFLNLLRFSYNTKTQSRSKIFTDVKYPEVLKLPVYVNGMDLDSMENVFNGHFTQMEYVEYNLCGVVVHSGLSSDGGHYYSYAKHWQTTSKSESSVHEWYLFNDSRVSRSNYRSFSAVTSKFAKDTAYVLVYKKVNENDVSASGVETALRSDLRDLVDRDNRAYIQEQELAQRARAALKSQANSNYFSGWKDDSDKGGGAPPGSCGGGGGGGFDSGPRFVC